jgi:hypothetical protein
MALSVLVIKTTWHPDRYLTTVWLKYILRTSCSEDWLRVLSKIMISKPTQFVPLRKIKTLAKLSRFPPFPFCL